MNKKNTPVFVGESTIRFTLSLLTLLLFSSNLISQSSTNSVTYFEDFNSKGYPSDLPNGSYWMYYNEIHPNQNNWNKFIPGDGNAYITVDADITNDLDWIHPFQTMNFGGVPENHRLEVRMKGAVVDGGLGWISIYIQTRRFNI